MEDQESDFVTIADGAARLGVSERTAWDVLRRSSILRYRLPGKGKTTFVDWDEFERAYRQPRPIGPVSDIGDDLKKEAA
jgi:hypothetical protein